MPNPANRVPMQISELPRYIIWPTDFFLSYFRHRELKVRKERQKLLFNSLNGDIESRYKLGRAVFLHSIDSATEWERRAYCHLGKRLLYKVLRNPDRVPGRNPVKASTYYGMILYLEGFQQEALHHWRFAADNNEAGAMFEMGKHFKKNNDRATALHWIGLAAGLNHSRAQNLLARMMAAPRPDFNLNPRAAELHIQEWMAHWGFHDARATPVGPDGGFDVKSSRAAAQVKFRGQPTPLEHINAFHGACNSRYEFEIFVSKSGYTKPARDAANEYGMAIFTLEEDGTPIPENFAAKRIYRD
jgi:hypothetical protein